MLFDDQLAALESDSRKSGHAGRRARLRAAGRRPRRRARAGHHDRRRLPLLLDRPAQVHRRRHPRPRAVHPQHDHRRVHRRLRGRPGRRAQGRAHADPPPQLPRLADRDPPRRPRGQQDGPRRLVGRALRRDRARLPRLRRPRSASRTSPASRSRACRARTSSTRRRDALVRRADADGVPRGGRARRGAHAARPVPHAGAVGQPARPRLPRLRRHDRGRHDLPGRPHRRPAVGADERGRAHRHLRRRPRAGRRRAVGHAHADRRDRHQPRRRHREGRRAPRGRAPVRGDARVDGRGADAAGPQLPDAHRRRPGDGDDHAAQVQAQRQLARAPRRDQAGAERDRRRATSSSTARSPSIPTRRTARPAASS